MLNLEALLVDQAALQDAATWRAVVAGVADILETGEPGEVSALQALRERLAPEGAYALDRASRQANAVVPLTIEGSSTWLELVMVPVLCKQLRGPHDYPLVAPGFEGLSPVERALEAALGVGFAAVHLLPWPVDARQLEQLDAYKMRLAVQQLGTFGDTTYLSPAEQVLDAEPADCWWLWPCTVQHTVAPQSLVSGVGAPTQHHWQRAAQLLEEKLMGWLLETDATGHVTVRQPVSWADTPEQLQRYKVLAWLSGLQSTKERPWSVVWSFSGTLLELTAQRPGSPVARTEFLFRPGQGAMVRDMLTKVGSRFPGELLAQSEAVQRTSKAR